MLKLQKTLIVGALGSVVITIVPWILTFGKNSVSLNPTDWGAFGDYFGGVLSGPLALVGFLALLVTIKQQREQARSEQKKTNDQKYFEGAEKALQRAFETIKPANTEAPVSNRLLWLTTARWLLAADALSKKISNESPALIDAYELEKENTRMFFRNFLRPTSMDSVFTQRHFFEGERGNSGSELEERSVRVVIDFMKWPDEKVDDLHGVSLYTREEADGELGFYFGFQAYVRAKRRFNVPEAEQVS